MLFLDGSHGLAASATRQRRREILNKKVHLQLQVLQVCTWTVPISVRIALSRIMSSVGQHGREALWVRIFRGQAYKLGRAAKLGDPFLYTRHAAGVVEGPTQHLGVPFVPSCDGTA